MSKVDLAAVDDQADFTRIGDGLQDPAGQRLIPLPHSNGPIVQQSAQLPGPAQQLHLAWNLGRHLALVDRFAGIQSGQQPSEGPQACHRS